MAKEESKAPKTEAKSNTFKAKVKMPGYSKRAIVTAKIGNKEISLMENEVIEVTQQEFDQLNLATSSAVEIVKVK